MKADTMSRQSVTGGNPEAVYTFHHTAMCPCMEPHDLFKDQVFDRERVRLNTHCFQRYVNLNQNPETAPEGLQGSSIMS